MQNKSKKAQVLGLPFSTIFSILLIIFFIVIAFIVIRHFLNLQDCGQVGIFKNDLQQEVDRAWLSDSYVNQFEANLPNGITHVCFIDWNKTTVGGSIEQEIYNEFYGYATDDNLFLYPRKKACNMENLRIEHIDIEKITLNKNPYCFGVNGKVEMSVSKGINDGFVKLS